MLPQTFPAPAATPPDATVITRTLTLHTLRVSKFGRRLRKWPEKLAAAMPGIEVEIEEAVKFLIFKKTLVRISGQDALVGNYVERVQELVTVYRTRP